MINKTPICEANISSLHKAVQKYLKCKHAVHYFYQMSCNLYYYAFDNATDIFHHCASCKVNTKEPTTKAKVRMQ
jgi:hypothetical protein